MSHHEIPDLDTNRLRQFGLMLGGVLALVFGVLLPWSWGLENIPNFWWIGAGLLVVAWALVAADSMRGLYRGWMHVAMWIGDVVNMMILSIVYFLVVTPMGIIMRALGKDPMHREPDPGAKTYRVMSKISPRNHFGRPF
ncbi:MAG: hypothetical protein D6690_07580 [Nitrospirae bacterium]|nr:MAG: hypothetical protein D6690_07580 [Nitrospirota bacterium]